MIKKYYLKNPIADAIKFTGNNYFDVLGFLGIENTTKEENVVTVFNYEGCSVDARVGDYIVKSPRGDFYVLNPKDFYEIYEEIV